MASAPPVMAYFHGGDAADFFSLGRAGGFGGAFIPFAALPGPGRRGQQHWGQAPYQQRDPHREHRGGQHSRQGKHRGVQKRHGSSKSTSHTDLRKLQRDNRSQAQHHFGCTASTPRTAPPAPENDNRFLTSATTGALVSPALHNAGFHLVTPNPFAPGSSRENSFWKNSYSTVDKDAAELGFDMGFDMYGSNTGLIARRADSDDEQEDDHGFDSGSDDDDEEMQGSGEVVGPMARAKLEEQAAHIAELEERNLNLVEKIYLLEQQLTELRKANAAGTSGASAALVAGASDHSSHSTEEDADDDGDQELQQQTSAATAGQGKGNIATVEPKS